MLLGDERGIKITVLFPYVSNLSDYQVTKLLEISFENDQIHIAKMCAKDFLPSIIASHGHLIEKGKLEFLKKRCAVYE